MSDSIHPLNPNAPLDPSPSQSGISRAANDLRAAAGEKTREVADSATHLKDRAISEATHLKNVAVDKATHLRDSATEKAEALRNAATARATGLRESAHEQWDDTRDKAREFQVTAEDYIRQNPTKAMLGALGVGFLVGLIMRR